MKLGTAVFSIFVFGLLVVGWFIHLAPAGAFGGGGYSKPEHCTGCSLDSEGNLTREFAISIPKEAAPDTLPADFDFSPVFTLSADGDSIQARCVGGRIEKSLHTEVTTGCHALLSHLNSRVKLTYHIAGDGSQNGDAFYYYTTSEGWKAEEILSKLDESQFSPNESWHQRWAPYPQKGE